MDKSIYNYKPKYTNKKSSEKLGFAIDVPMSFLEHCAKNAPTKEDKNNIREVIHRTKYVQKL